jgi:uncharacterized protein involved in exopolysaccharide biosynthesis
MTSESYSEPSAPDPTLRDLLTPIFRHMRAGILIAVAVFIAISSVVLTRPRQYQAEMKILVKRERLEPLVSGDPNVRPQPRTDVTEDEINSEVELLRSRDLLEQIAIAAGLHDNTPRSESKQSLGEVVRQLQSRLNVRPIRKTTFISVTYSASDPVAAARVLEELARLYPEKHLALHRPPGAFEFFSAQAERFRNELSESEARLKEYGRQEHIVSADVEKQNTLQRLSDFEAALQQARGALADTARRIGQLESELATTPTRQTTQIRTSQNGDLSRDLASRILELEGKQAEMARKFAPSYPPAVAVEQELNHARAALARAEQVSVTEETTDHNPTYQWLQNELARVKSERAASEARAAALTTSVDVYRQKARQLDEQSLVQQHLTRAVKSAEESYLLYRRKQEEARISDALDRTRIVNVAIAEAPRVPEQPLESRASSLLALAALVALFVGIGTTYVLQHFSPYFHTPDDVESTLDIPVLASIPGRR